MSIIYCVVTDNGYWGIGDDLMGALANANVGDEFVKCGIFKINRDLIQGDVRISDYGSILWTWDTTFYKELENNKHFMEDVSEIMDMGKRRYKIKKNTVIIEFGED